jgi:RNA polymerase sigma-70 factor, ECF subfamily
METDGTIVCRVLAGDTAAYGDLVRRHEQAVVAAAASILSDVHAAQDAAQETFLVAHQRLATLRNGDAFGPWTVRISQRMALRMRRRRDKAGRLEQDVEAGSPLQNGQLDDDVRRVLATVMKLPETQRQAVLLRYFSGLDLDTIAQVTGQPAGTVRSHLSRAVARLRERLGDWQP